MQIPQDRCLVESGTPLVTMPGEVPSIPGENSQAYATATSSATPQNLQVTRTVQAVPEFARDTQRLTPM